MSEAALESDKEREIELKAARPSREHYTQANKAARAELQMFLEAITSYPDRFAVDPRITFEQHRSSLIVRNADGSIRTGTLQPAKN